MKNGTTKKVSISLTPEQLTTLTSVLSSVGVESHCSCNEITDLLFTIRQSSRAANSGAPVYETWE